MTDCEKFNVVRRGMCKTPLRPGKNGPWCPNWLQHGDEFDTMDSDHLNGEQHAEQ